MLGHFLFVQTYLLIGLPWVSTETVGTFINVSMPQYGQRKKCGLSISTSCLPKIASILLNAFVIQLRGIFSMLGLLFLFLISFGSPNAFIEESQFE